MNREAQTHLSQARAYLGRGEEFYRKAAEEILAAKQADESLTLREIDRQLDQYNGWAGKLLTWHESGGNISTPYAGQYAKVKANLTRSTLRDAPMEEVERVISELPRERQQQIAAAAGSGYHKARVEFNERERNLTPAERSEREAAAESLMQPVRQATAGFAALGIVGHLEQAHEEIHELVADNSLSRQLVRQIDRALEAIQAEMQVARALVGIEADDA